MDKTPKIGENFSTHKPQSGLENIPFLNGLVFLYMSSSENDVLGARYSAVGMIV